MARPKKNKVDYFPHMVTSGKTLYILEQKWGNDGYAFWFKLLEIIGDTEGHYFCTENDADWEFLIAKTHVTGETASEILETLAKLNAIDPELWEKNIIWSQNFIDNIQDVYLKRRLSVPKKPLSEGFWPENPQQNDVSAPKMRQSKVKESKVNKRENTRTEKNENLPENKFIVEAQEFEEFLNQNEPWKEQLCMSTHTTMDRVEKAIPEFAAKLRSENITKKGVADIYSHFANWYRIKTQENGNSKNNYRTKQNGTKQPVFMGPERVADDDPRFKSCI